MNGKYEVCVCVSRPVFDRSIYVRLGLICWHDLHMPLLCWNVGGGDKSYGRGIKAFVFCTVRISPKMNN